MKKFLCVLLSLFLFCMPLTGCYDKVEIDDQTYVIAIGLDKGTVHPLRLTLRYALPKAFGSGENDSGGSGGGGQGKNMNSVTLDTPTLNSGLTVANTFVGKRLDMSHAVLVVISKEIAEKGVSSYINGIARGRQYRPSLFIAISRGTAKEYLDTINPVQEADPSKYFELLFHSYRYTGYFPKSQFFNFYTNMTSLGAQPSAILAGVGKYENPDQFKSSQFTSSETPKVKKGAPTEADFKAGDIPKTGDIQGEVMGLAVFNGDKMIGELDGEEARCHLMVMGEYEQSYFSMPDPITPNQFLLIRLSKGRNPQRKVTYIDEKPHISVDIHLEGDFTSIQNGANYEDPEKLPFIETAISKLIKENISAFLQKTTKEFNSDICGFGKIARKNYLTMDSWEAAKWFDQYKNATFDVSVDVKIRRPGLLIRTAPVIHSKGGDVNDDNSK